MISKSLVLYELLKHIVYLCSYCFKDCWMIDFKDLEELAEDIGDYVLVGSHPLRRTWPQVLEDVSYH